ncbi:MAG: SPOR domain-containing protein [Alphaproteobacteria bacterium]|nr:SPOR domain-containing protein [Alphaproteobacteria bacterium]
MRIIVLPALLFLLDGCAALAIPPALTAASYATDGVSYLATDKTITDHMLSDALGQNCAVWRILRGRSICKDFTPEEVAARAKARRETRHDEERAQVAQVEGPYSPSGTIEGTAIALAPKKESKPSVGAGRTKVTAEGLPAIAPAAGGSGTSLRTKPRTISGILTRTLKAKPAPKTVRTTSVGRSSISSRRARSAPLGPRRFIVFGSFRNKRAAARLARRHQILDPFVVPARVRGTTYYRVVAQPEGRASIALAFRSLKRAGVRDAYAISACRGGRVNARCLRQVPRRDRVPTKSLEDMLMPKNSALPGPAAPVADG